MKQKAHEQTFDSPAHAPGEIPLATLLGRGDSIGCGLFCRILRMTPASCPFPVDQGTSLTAIKYYHAFS